MYDIIYLLIIPFEGDHVLDKKNKTPRFKLFDITKDGKGIGKSSSLRRSSLKRFFISYKDNIGKITTVNILMVLGNFPIFFLIAALAGYTKAEAYLPFSDLFHGFSGTFASEGVTPDTMTLLSTGGIQEQILVPTTLTYVFYAIGALVIFTFGFVNVGTAYILRNIAKGEPVFVFSDFIYAVKRNWRQALIYGIIDVLINGILLFNLYNLIFGESAFFASVLFWATVILFIIYFMMRYYIYIQMVTFKLSIFKIIKNSLIFTLVGMKRNVVALFGIALMLLFEFLFVFAFGGVLISFAVALPLLIFFSSAAYMKVYAAYFKIEELMIEPYYEEHPDERPVPESDGEVLMRDDVTEMERIEEIKKRNGINGPYGTED